MTDARRRQYYRSMFRDNVRRRLVTDRIVRAAVLAAVVAAIVPLGSILVEVVRNGVSAISVEFLTEIPGAVGSGEGGIGPAIQGTLIVVGMASMLGVPVGLLSGVFLAEFGDNRLARTVRFFNDVFMEFPSIVIGIFAFLVVVLALGHFSVWAGAFALALIMFPIVTRTTEESLKMVPQTYREAGVALGLRQWVITARIVMSAARGGMITGILLAVSRISGETAPLLFTILGSSQFFGGFGSPMDALPLRIWTMSLLPYEGAQQHGWGAALVLILIIMCINMAVRYIVLGDNSRFNARGRVLFLRAMGRR